MPLGLISDDDFLSELENSAITVLSGQVIERPPLGRGPGNIEVPDTLRKIIGETSNIESPSDAVELAQNFGISRSSVSAYANGSTSLATYNKPDDPLKSHIDSAKLKVSKRASSKLMKALHHITDDKLGSAKAVELATIAKSLSGVVRDMEPDTPKNPGLIGGGNQIILYAPRLIAEGALDSVRVEE
jgi:hypothetical protein